MAGPCTYHFTDENGNEVSLKGLAAFQAYLAEGGLEHLFPKRKFPWTTQVVSARGAYSRPDQPRFYSALKRAFANAPDKVFGNPEQIKLWINGNASKYDVKKDEIYWSGLNDWLDMQTGKVSRDDVLRFMDENGVKVEDVVLGETAEDMYKNLSDEELADRYLDNFGESVEEEYGPDWADSRDDVIAYLTASEEGAGILPGVKHNTPNLTLPGGVDYRELVITIPTAEKFNEHDTTHFGDVGEGKQIAWIRHNTRTDADGNTGLFLEEVQSQRGQEGRSRGFFTPENSKDSIAKKLKNIDNRYSELSNKQHQLFGDELKAARDEMDSLTEQHVSLTMELNKASNVPSAPFTTDSNNKATNAYITLLMKKAVSQAIDDGKNFVAWTTGDQQADRYDLSKQVKKLGWHEKESRLDIFTTESGMFSEPRYEVTKDKLAEYVGKEVAEKLVNAKADRKGVRTLEGLDLKVGGGWTQAMYGNEQGLNAQGKPSLIMQAANELARKFGGEVGSVELLTSGDWQQQPALIITPAMREKILGEGMPLFAREKSAVKKPSLLISESEAVQHLLDNFGVGIRNLIDNGVLRFTNGKQEWPEAARKAARGDEEAVYINGKAYIDLTSTGRERLTAVVLHELGEHYSLRRMLGDNAYRALQQQITNRAKITGSRAEKVWNEVKRNYDHLEEGSEAFVSEVIAKLGELDPKAPWYRRLISQIKAFLMQHGLARGVIAGTISESDLHDLLRASLDSAAKGFEKGEPRLFGLGMAYSVADKNKRPDMLGFLEEFAKDDEIFGYPVSGKKDLAGVMREVAPMFKYRPELNAYVTEAKEAPTKVFKTESGKPAYVVEGGGKVWIDVSSLRPGDRGGAFYAAVGNYAYNNGLEFIDDPAGVSREAVLRRPQHMLSLALKFGTTDFLGVSKNFEEQSEKHGLPLLNWSTDSDRNLVHLIIRNVTPIYQALPGLRDIKYDFEAKRFRRITDGRALQDVWAKRISVDETARRNNIGEATIRRAVFLQSLASSSREEKSRLLEELGATGRLAGGVPLKAAFSRPEKLPEKITIDGKERHTTNSDGQQIHPTEQGIRNFWKWFADSAVVDEQGRPQVMYHGTTKDFTNFDIGEAGQKDTGWYGTGFYFTPDTNTASAYADYDQEATGQNVIPVYLKIENPFEWESDVKPMQTKEQSDGFRRLMLKMGIDGVFAENKYADPKFAKRYEVVAFNPEQIKSATGNTGDFSGESNDIRFSRLGDKIDQLNRTPEGDNTWLGDVIDTLDKAADTVFRKRLAFLSVKQIIEVAKHYMPGLNEYEGYLQSREALISKWLRKADRLVSETWRKLPEPVQRQLAGVMHESTLADVHAGIDWAGVREIFGEDASQGFEAYTQYNLAPSYKEELLRKAEEAGAAIVDGKAIFRTEAQARAFLPEIESAEAALKKFRQKNFPEIFAKEEARENEHRRLSERYKALPEQAQKVYTEATIMHGDLFNDRLEELKKRIASAVENGQKQKALLAQIREKFESQSINWYYAPLARYGSYWFYGEDANGERWFSTFETERQWKRGKKEFQGKLLGEGRNLDNLELLEGEQVSDSFIKSVQGQIAETVADKDTRDLLQDQIYQMFLQTLPDISVRHSSMHRKGTKGYTEAAMRAYSSAMHHGATQLGNMKYGREMRQVLTDHDKAKAVASGKERRDAFQAVIDAAEMLQADWKGKVAKGVLEKELAEVLGISDGDLNAAMDNLEAIKTELAKARDASEVAAMVVSDASKPIKSISSKLKALQNKEDAGKGILADKAKKESLEKALREAKVEKALKEKELSMAKEVEERVKDKLQRAKDSVKAENEKIRAAKSSASRGQYQANVIREAISIRDRLGADHPSPSGPLGHIIDENQKILLIASAIPMSKLTKAADVLDELVLAYDHMVKYSSTDMDRVVSLLNQMNFVNMLGFGLSSGIVNMVQTPGVAIPVAAGRHGAKSVPAFNRAFAQFMKAVASGKRDVDGNASITEELRAELEEAQAAKNYARAEELLYEIRMLEGFKDDGTISRTQTFDIIGVGREGASYGGRLQEFAKWSGWMFHHGERLNREVTLAAAYRLEKARLMSEGQSAESAHFDAIEYARYVNNRAHLDYSSENAARIFRGPLARIALQFKKYQQGMLFLWGKSFADAIGKINETEFERGEDGNLTDTGKGLLEAAKRNRQEARRTFMALLFMQGSLAGALSMPMMGAISAVYGLLGAAIGDDDEPWDLEKDLRLGLAKYIGELPAEIAAKGFVNSLTSVNLASRLDQADIFFKEPLKEMEGRDAATAYLAEVLGPTGGTVAKAWQGMSYLADGYWMRGAEAMTPKFVGDIIKAARFAEEGAKTLDNMPLKDMSAMESFMQGLGFGSSLLERRYAERGFAKEREAAIKDTRTKIMREAAWAKIKGEPVDMAAIRAWNIKHPEKKILAENVSASMKGIKQSVKIREEKGYSVDPKLEYLYEENEVMD